MSQFFLGSVIFPTVHKLSHTPRILSGEPVVGITIFCSSFVFSQSCVKVSASLTNVGSLAVGAFDLVNCSLSVVGFVPVFYVGQ